jgi:hypothetical protein
MVTVDPITAETLENLSKTTALDCLIDMIRGEMGDDATPAALLARLQRTLDPVARLRGDRAPDLLAVRQRIAAQHAAALERIANR